MEQLAISWDEFSKQIDLLTSETDSILILQNSIKTEKDLNSIIGTMNEWIEKSYNFLKTSFNNQNNDFATSFYRARKERFRQPGNDDSILHVKKKEVFEDFLEKLNTLKYNKKIIGISDAIINPEKLILSDRSEYTTDEILDLILEKLYALYDNHYHSIPMILEGNGIKERRSNEDREFAKLLEDYGYITTIYTRFPNAQLTLNGKIYVEEKKKTYKENYENIKQSQIEINDKIDFIISELKKVGYGQEIIFDEIQELKDLYGKVSKKNWGQIVKGKLIDLALAKLIENDTVKYIYESLTDHKFRLP